MNNFSNHDFVGTVNFALHEVVTARDQTLERQICNDKRAAGKRGTIKITGEEKQVTSAEEVIMKASASFPSMNGMYFFLIHKQISPTVWKPVYKSEIQNAVGGRFNWNLVNILTADLAGDDIERPIRIDFLQSQKSGKHKHMG